MIDWSQLESLKAEMGESFPEIVALFLEEAGEIVIRLEHGKDRDARMLAADLHALKGAALNLGLDSLARRCAEGEKNAEAGQPGKIELPALIACYHDSCALLEARL